MINVENIGNWAGLVWNALNDAQKALSLKDHALRSGLAR